MATVSSIEIMTPESMVSLGEMEHLELLESVAQRLEKAERKFDRNKTDHNMADVFELMLLYHRLDVDPKRPKWLIKDLLSLPAAIADLRAAPRRPLLACGLLRMKKKVRR